MKTLRYIVASCAVLLSTVSCYNLDILPKNTVTEDVLLSTDAGIQKYLTLSYHQLPVEDFLFYVNSEYMVFDRTNRWDGVTQFAGGPATEAAVRTMKYEGFDFWTFRSNEGHGPYNRIRELNNFLASIGNYWEGEELAEYQAEARFLRAFYYFVLVRFHGGVVIMDEPLNPLADPLELQLPRSTEKECYDFIYKDLEFAMENGRTTSTLGRMNRYTAAAFATRTMLYAATISKYSSATGITGPATQAGLMNMSSQYADEFFQRVIDAAEVVQEGGYSLHNGADKEAAFVELFQKVTDDEDIFVKQYGRTSNNVHFDQNLTHFWDIAVLPRGAGLAGDMGCIIDPTYNLLKLFEMPAIVDENGYPVRFNSLNEFWDTDELEPRAKATYYFSGQTEQASGAELDFLGGVYKTFKWPDGRPGLASDATSDSGNRSQNAFTGSANQGIRILETDGGRQGTVVTADNAAQYGNLPVGTKVNGVLGISSGGDEQKCETGFIIRKHVSNDVNYRGWRNSITPWKTIRYGEVLLNLAEAQYELGLSEGNADLKRQAFENIALIRERAGATPYEMKENPREVGLLPVEDGGKGYIGISIDENLQFIRDERARELAFENHRIYDLIRWRTADQDFMNRKGRIQAFMPYYILDEGKYIYLTENSTNGRVAEFNKSDYYRQIPGGAIEKNPKLVINDRN